MQFSMKASSTFEIMISNFPELTLSHSLAEIIEAEGAMASALSLFDAQSSILPAQCDELTQALSDAAAAAETICHLLDNPSLLQSQANVFKYSFVNGLYRTHRLSNEVNGLLVKFRPICFTKTSRTQKLRQRIAGVLSELLAATRKVAGESRPIVDHYQKMNDAQYN